MKHPKLFVLTVLTLVCTAVSAQINSSTFINASTWSSGTGNSGVAGLVTDDLDGDGKPDVVSVNQTNNSMSVFRNISVGNNINFAPKIDSSGYAGSVFPFIADLNFDNKKEVIISHFSTNSLKIFRNFSSPGIIRLDSSINLPIPASSPAAVHAADFNRDGKVDLATANFYGNTATILQNTTAVMGGIPTFAPGVNLSTAATGTASSRVIASALLDSDTLLDLVVVNYTNSTISIFRNTSTPSTVSFAARQTFTVNNLATGVDFGDLDKDGKLDIVVGSATASSGVMVFRNTSVGNTISLASSFVLNGIQVLEVRLADFDMDGKLDIAASNNTTGYIAIFKNNFVSGTLTSSSFAARVDFANQQPGGAYAISTADINLDGKPDLTSSNTGTHSIEVKRNAFVANQPTLPSSGLSIVASGFTGCQLTWNKGNGSRRIVVAKKGNYAPFTPLINGVSYTANSQYGLGSALDTLAFVVYNDTGSSVTVTGLIEGQRYHFSVFEYNGLSNYTNYLQNPFDSGFYWSIYKYFYAKSSGPLDSLSSWGRNSNGTGTQPTSFNLPNQIFVVTNNLAPTITSNWFITGNNTGLVVNNGYNLVIPNGSILGVDSIAVLANGLITDFGNLYTNKGFFQDSSTYQLIGSNQQYIPSFSFFNLVCAGMNKTLNGNIVVRNNLTSLVNLNGANHTITIGTSAANPGTLNASGFFDGRITKWIGPTSGNVVSFPIGNTSSQQPVTLTLSGTPSAYGTISAQFVSSNPGITGLPIFDFTTSPVIQINKTALNGYWNIASANGLNLGAASFQIAATANGFWGINNVSELRLIRRNNTASGWQITGNAATNTGSASSATVVRTAVNAFGDFSVSGNISNNPLPVSLVYFNGSVNDRQVNLKWQTASEQNTSYFEPQILLNNEWVDLGKVKAKGNSQSTQNYVFSIDNVLENDGNYLRLKIVDFDDSYEFSKSIFIQPTDIENEIKLYPNPTHGLVYLGKDAILLQVSDLKGKIVEVHPNNNYLDLSDLENGNYLIMIQVNDMIVHKIINKY